VRLLLLLRLKSKGFCGVLVRCLLVLKDEEIVNTVHEEEERPAAAIFLLFLRD
jgi:hypothetical protein